MDDENSKSTRARNLAAVTVLLATIGATAFWTWRRTAPLTRRYRRTKQQPSEELSG